jgi:hypothetical protein
MVAIARFFGSISHGALMDGWAQEADVIARAAVRGGLDCLPRDTTLAEKRVVRLSQADIVRLGRVEYAIKQ